MEMQDVEKQAMRQHIEDLRQKLERYTRKYQYDFSHPKLIEISQSIDQALNVYQRAVEGGASARRAK